MLAARLLTSIGLPFTTISKPVELPLCPPCLGSLDLVPRQLLLLDLGLRYISSFYLGSGSRCSGTSGGTRGGSRRRTGSCSRSTDSRVGSRRLDVVESVFDEGNLTLVGKSTGVDVPDFGTECVDELHVMRDNANRSGPFSNGDGKTTEGFSVQEIGRLVELERNVSPCLDTGSGILTIKT